MATRGFSRALLRLESRRFAAGLSERFERKQRAQVGTVLGNGSVVQVEGQTYDFRNTANLALAAGDTVSVVNVGSPGNAVYAPATGGGAAVVGAGGSGSGGGSSGTLADHDHSGAVGSGGALSGYLAKSGGTLTGPLTLSGDPTSDLHAATKQYIDGIFATIFPHLVVHAGDVVTHEGEVIWAT